MYPHERSLVKKLESKPFALIGVNSDGNREQLKPILAKENITWRSFWNGPGGTKGPIASAWRVNGWPTLYLIDAKGVIRKQWLGSPPTALLDNEIDSLIREIEGKKI